MRLSKRLKDKKNQYKSDDYTFPFEIYYIFV